MEFSYHYVIALRDVHKNNWFSKNWLRLTTVEIVTLKTTLPDLFKLIIYLSNLNKCHSVVGRTWKSVSVTWRADVYVVGRDLTASDVVVVVVQNSRPKRLGDSDSIRTRFCSGWNLRDLRENLPDEPTTRRYCSPMPESNLKNKFKSWIELYGKNDNEN
jgi:hypothetical protein